jgi:formylglycine-generating enzyme required for sulfatase activity/tRNA A-37 threonylcarbamoyl transferase component Bud32
MSVTLTEFVRDLATLGLLAPADLSTLETQSAGNPETVAKELVQQGKLTRYQAAAVYQGKASTLLVGNYLILDRIGAGGMGQVFRARHRKMDRVVALKVLPKKSMASPDAVERFQREVKAAAKLTHPNIVTAHDADEAGGTHFLVMELVEGSDLSALVKSEGPLPIAKALSCILQAARGLQHAHAAGVIHRDIKPSNLLLDKNGKIKILDMGLARITDSNPETGDNAPGELTQTGSMMGTVDYMAPEQALNTHQADARADVYSLGCTLYYLLTGRPPYSGETAMKRLVAHRESPIPTLRAARPEVSAELDRIYHRMVAKQVAERYQSMNEVIAALEPLTRTPAPAPAAVVPLATGGSRRTLMLGAGGAVVVIVLLVGFAMRPKPAADEPPEPLARAPVSVTPAAPSVQTASNAPAKPLEQPAATVPPVVQQPADAKPAEPPPVTPAPVAVKPDAPVTPAAPSPLPIAAPTIVAMQPPAAAAPQRDAEAPAAVRRPVPDAAAQKTALAVIKQIFEADYAAAKTAEGKTTLARKLLAQADKTTDDPAARFVLLAEARDLAAETADTEMLDQAVDALGADYQVNALAMQADIYKKLASKSRPAAANKALAEKALALADLATAEQQFDVAEPLLKSASLIAGKARDATLVKQARLNSEELAGLRHQLEAVNKAEAALATSADDPDANLTLGRYLCFDQDDWQAGLPHLAKGSDAELKNLAVKSLAAPTDAGAMLALGDAWWDAADARKGKEATLVRSGARHWYAAALPELTGINKTKVEKRLEESQAAAAAGPKFARATSAKPAAKGPLKPAIAPFSADEAKQLQQSWAQSRRVPVEVTNSAGMKLVFIPPGEFMLGTSPEQIAALTPRYRDTSPLQAEQPQHKVRISKPFYLGMYEVTQQEYTAVTGKNPSYYSPSGKGKDQMAGVDTSRFPVESVSWADAAAFCDALSSLPAERAARRVYRLPTEAEWEFACRAGTTTLWSFGDDEKEINRFAWCNQPKTATPHVVGGDLPNAFGLFDMHGNINEFCLDWFTKEGYVDPRFVDPQGPPTGEGRATRGGAYLNSDVANRSAVRHLSNPTYHYPERGFRVLCGVR